MAENRRTNMASQRAGFEEDAGRLWIRRADQAAVAGLVTLALAMIAMYVIREGFLGGRMIDIDRAPPLSLDTRIDLNQAEWPELTLLPGISETFARRIVEDRRRNGAYVSVDDLERVPGIGPKTVENLRPFVLPLASSPNAWRGNEAASSSP